MTPKYRGATSIPAKMWKKLIEIARMYPNPAQFYDKAIALGKEYDIGEKELIAWGTIDPYHKPPTRSVASVEEKIIRSAAQTPTPNHYEPHEQSPPPVEEEFGMVTEEDIVRGHRKEDTE